MRDTKDYIVLTALKLFLCKSYKDVTMKDIVAATGLSKGAFYHYFDSKENVFEAVVRLVYEQQMFLDFGDLPNDSLKIFYTGYIENVRQINDQFMNLGDELNFLGFVLDAAKLVPDFTVIYKNSKQIERKYWQTAVKNGRERNEITVGLSDEAIADLFIHLKSGLIFDKASKYYHDYTNFLTDLTQTLDNFYDLVAANTPTAPQKPGSLQ